MALLDGKQLRNGSTDLGKLSGSGTASIQSGAILSFLSGAQLTTADSNINNGTDVVNKNYVDGIAAGLLPKTPVQAIANTQSLALSGVGMVIDGWTVSSGDRILANAQAGQNIATYSNGIYVAAAGSWSRATDSDGTPSNEVQQGNFVFVHEGATYLHTGWVLAETNASNPQGILVGTESQRWVQFSEQTNIQAGDGLSYNGVNLNVNTGVGLTISVDQVRLTDTAVTPTSYGNATNVATFTVDQQGRLTAASNQLISIPSGQVNNFTASVLGFQGQGLTSNGSSLNVDLASTSGLTFSAAGDAGQLQVAVDGTTVGINSQGQLYATTQGDITGVTAGAGLSGGGTQGFVTLDVNTTNGLSIISDSVGLGGTLSIDTKIANGANFFTMSSTGGDIYFNTVDGAGTAVIRTLVTNGAGITSSILTSQDNNVIKTLDATNRGGELDTTSTGSFMKMNSSGGVVATFSVGLSSITSTINGSTLNMNSTNTSIGDGSTNNRIIITDSANSKGVVYAGDYTANFTTYSLVTKGYVDSVVTSTGLTAQNGLTETAPNVVELGGTLTQDTIINTNGNMLIATGSGDLIFDKRGGGLSESHFVNLNDVTTEIGCYTDVDAGNGAKLSISATYSMFIDTAAIGLHYDGDYSGNNTTNPRWIPDKQYVDSQVAAGVTAGTGLFKSGNTIGVSYSAVAQIMGGAGLTANGNVFDVGAGAGITVNVDAVAVDYTAVSTQLAGNGLINNGTTIDVNAGLGLTVSGDLVQVASSIAGTGLTFSAGVLSVVAGSSQPVYQIGLTTSVTTGETGILLSSTPNDYSRIQVFVNGQLQMLGDGVTSRDCHFGTTTSAVGLASLTSGNQLVWNSSNAGFSLSTTDRIDIIYEA